ncbi:MAG: DNA methyltransferase [Candidatus Heimdallarchaeota archaeon]
MKQKEQDSNKKEDMTPEERVWNEWKFHSTVWHFSSKDSIPNRWGYASIPTLAEKLILKYTAPNTKILCFDKSMDSIFARAKTLGIRTCSYADFHDFTETDMDLSTTAERMESITRQFDGIFATLPWWTLIEKNQPSLRVHEATRQFLSRTKILLSKCFEILQDSCFIILDIRDVVVDHVIPLGAFLMQQSLDVGFNLWDVIHYDLADKPSPSEAFSSFSYLLILQKRKQGWKYLQLRDTFDWHLLKPQNIKEHLKIREDHNCCVWNFNVGGESRTLTHGFEYHSEDRYIKSKRKIYEKTLFAGKLVPQLVRKLILEYSQPEDTLFDFFVGTGTVILEGVHCGRKSFGIDINPAAVELAIRKIQAYQESLKDSEALESWSVEQGNAIEGVEVPDDSVDLIFVHPPYWGLVKYTDLAEDLSNMRLGAYLEAIRKVFQEAYRILKTEGFFVVVIGDKRKSGLVPLGSYLQLLGIHQGFRLWDLILNDTEFGGKQHNYFAQIKSKMYKFHLTDHDYILLFKKCLKDT